ncbi:MAG: amino acid decarboxylase [Gemmatimonadetes bacterium]|nr:amino acid decarboxylase [Gemmatimonadota bacterium]
MDDGVRVRAGGTGDMPPEVFREHARAVADWMADYLAGVGELPVLAPVRPGDVRRSLPGAPPDAGEPMERILEDFRDRVMPGVTHWNHPDFFAYFAVTGSGPGILGEMVAAALNVNAMVWRSSPAATELEELTLDWLRQLLGLPAGFDGTINDTASLSTLHALAAARAAAYPEAGGGGLAGAPRGRVYCSEQAHSSVDKAVLTLGFGREGVRHVATDEAFRMRPDALAAALEEDRVAGVRPVAVVATLGTTSTTSVDPVADVARLAGEHGCWLHVDAAYAGPAAMVPELAHHFAGWEEADSIVVNPHKWLFTPIDCSVLYTRRPDVLRGAFSLTPEYLRTAEQGEARNLMDYGVALGRRFRSLKLWFVLRWFGREGIVARLRAHVAWASELADRLDEAPGWERGAPVPFSTVVLRWAPEGLSPEEQDAANARNLDRVNAGGRAFLSHTVLGERTWIRVSIGNLRTTREDVARVWGLLEEAAGAEG